MKKILMDLTEIPELLNFLEQEQQKEIWGVVVRVMGEREAEDLAEYLAQNDFSVRYIHDEIDPLCRLEIITDFTFGITNILVAPIDKLLLPQPHFKEILFINRI